MTKPWMQEAQRDARCLEDEAYRAHQRERLEAARLEDRHHFDEAHAREVCSFKHFDTLRRRVAEANIASEAERRIFLEDCDAAAVPAAYPGPDDRADCFTYP